jgi:hypothetical protein
MAIRGIGGAAARPLGPSALPVALPLALAVALGIASFAGIAPAAADKFRNPTAIFAGLDKITGRIIAFDVAVNETVQFGALQLTPRVCYSRPQTENPHTTSFIEVDEITLQNEQRRIFNGWVFASSPGLNAIEHPVYDIWLTGCKGATERDLIRETTPVVETIDTSPTGAAETRAAIIGPDGRPIGAGGDTLRTPGSQNPNQRRQQVNRSETSGPIIPGQPLNTVPTAQARPQRPAPSQSFFPTFNPQPSRTGNPGILLDPRSN